jgi:hypothetical protein
VAFKKASLAVVQAERLMVGHAPALARHGLGVAAE